jgi:GT2 family glycosyltransferase
MTRYLDVNPKGLQHRDGPLGHYSQYGAAAGAQVNNWYTPDPAAQPRGLIDWVYADARQWIERRQVALPGWGRVGARAEAGGDLGPVEDESIGTTTVILVAERDSAEVRHSVTSVIAQTTKDWQLLVLTVEGGVDPQQCGLPDDPRVLVEDGRHATVWAARNHGLDSAQGRHVAFMVAGDEWLPGRLSSVHQAFLDSGSAWVHDCARDESPKASRRHASRHATRDRLLAGVETELGTLVVSTELARSLGGFNESLPSGHVLDLMVRLSERDVGGFAPRLGVRLNRDERRANRRVPASQRPWVTLEELASANDAVLNTHLIDWPGLAKRDTINELVSVLIFSNGDWQLTSAAVRSVEAVRGPGSRIEVVVVEGGADLVASAALAALGEEFDDVRVLRSPADLSFALGNNLALADAHGTTVVCLADDVEVQPGWLAPLVDSLTDEAVLAAQSLVLDRTGSVQSAGVVFPRGGGIPHPLLNGFPVEDTVGIGTCNLRALTGAALAMRFSDAVALHGFDPVFRNGFEDVDLCLRLAELRPGRFVVRPDSMVLHRASRVPDRSGNALANRRVLMDRWTGRLPEDDVGAWARLGYIVQGHEVRVRTAPDRRLCTAQPVLIRRPRPVGADGLPSLRWALKIASPFGLKGEAWGDTHFARQLARSLRNLGQDVVVDYRGAFHRVSEHLDDVVLLLRGRAPYSPLLDRVNLTWLISHPDMFGPSDHLGMDRVYVASTSYAAKLAAAGVPAVPLHQATEPALFHPDLADPDTGHRALFVGNSRGEARPLVMAAVERNLPLTVFGAGWSALIPEHFIHSSYLPNAEVGAAYRASRVVLNDHWPDMSANGFLSNRLFDAVAAGARVISDDVPGIEEVFGDAVQVARTPEELDELVNAADLDGVFGTDELRRQRAQRISADHSFAARARVLLEDAVSIRERRGLR